MPADVIQIDTREHQHAIKRILEAFDKAGVRHISSKLYVGDYQSEHGGMIKTLDDVKLWKNPRLKESPKAITGERLHKALLTMTERYGIEILFCDKRVTGKRIMEILGVGNGEK